MFFAVILENFTLKRKGGVVMSISEDEQDMPFNYWRAKKFMDGWPSARETLDQMRQAEIDDINKAEEAMEEWYRKHPRADAKRKRRLAKAMMRDEDPKKYAWMVVKERVFWTILGILLGGLIGGVGCYFLRAIIEGHPILTLIISGWVFATLGLALGNLRSNVWGGVGLICGPIVLVIIVYLVEKVTSNVIPLGVILGALVGVMCSLINMDD